MNFNRHPCGEPLCFQRFGSHAHRFSWGALVIWKSRAGTTGWAGHLFQSDSSKNNNKNNITTTNNNHNHNHNHNNNNNNNSTTTSATTTNNNSSATTTTTTTRIFFETYLPCYVFQAWLTKMLPLAAMNRQVEHLQSQLPRLGPLLPDTWFWMCAVFFLPGRVRFQNEKEWMENDHASIVAGSPWFINPGVALTYYTLQLLNWWAIWALFRANP